MNTTPLRLLLSKLPSAKKNGRGWSARCPAHEDRRPSLSIAEADDGRALVNCHAGCAVEAICEAVGMRVSDLMPAALSTSTEMPKPPGNGQYRRQQNGKAGQTFQTANDAVVALSQNLGKHSALWTYYDVEGTPVGAIVRWDKPNGKDIRPVARRGDRWTIGGMSEPRPLYCLPELPGAERVYITEGEKAADAAREIGLIATTSAHGSQSPDKTDWSTLAGKECVILPDNDNPGATYADTVVAILAKATPAAVVSWWNCPTFPTTAT